MAKRFLTDINLSNNQLISSSFEQVASDPSTNLFVGRMIYNTTDELVKVYTSTNGWAVVGAITDVQGTTNEIEVSVDGSGVATVGLPTNIHVDVTGDLTGNADTATYATTAGTANAVAADSVALGTDTTGDYVASVSGTDGVSITGTGEGAAVTVANTDKGSSQNIFKHVAVSGVGNIDADSNDTTVNVVAGTGISLANSMTSMKMLQIDNNDKGSDQNIFKTINAEGGGNGSISAATNNDSVNFVAGNAGLYITAGDGNVTLYNNGVISIDGTANEIEVTGESGAFTVGLPNDVTIGNNLTVSGDLIVSGTTTTVNTETINLADNIITLNSNFTGATPTEDAGLEVERGDLTNVVFRWNETTDVWEATTDGTNYYTVLLSGQTNASDIADFTEAAQDAVASALTSTSNFSWTYDDSGNQIIGSVIYNLVGGIDDNGSGLEIDYATVEAQLVTDGFSKKVAANVGDGAATSFAITHSLGTRDVVVNVYDNASYDTVECDVVRTDANNVTVSFNAAPASAEYRVVIIG